MGKHSIKGLVMAGLITLGAMGIGGGTVMAQSQDISIDGDHGKLVAVLQTPEV